MPDFAIVDSHVHIWDPGRIDYPWLRGAGGLDRAFLPADFAVATGPVAVEAMVFLECDAHPDAALEEARWVLEQAREESRIEALVCFAPLEKGDGARDHLEALAEIPKVRGVRRIYQDEADTGFCLRPGFVAGVRALADYGLSFDICISHPHLESTIALARACPEVPMVLDHIGKPPVAEGRLEPWRSGMFALARLENVVCKLSGVATEADHARWTPDQLRPFIDTALDAFGPDRVMFGGDWPVSTRAIAYPRWVELVDDTLAGFSDADRRKVYRDTARRFYRL